MPSIKFETPDGIEIHQSEKIQYKDNHWHVSIGDSEEVKIIPREKVYSVRKNKSKGGGEYLEW
ncbi:hypothetical protein [Halobaculum sp. EA56]|uniref:hypothetical protein n=1 Tax=Halobaculum sp. EA56 TaxID=3421648 RepID=UPI003EBF433F